MNPAEPRSSRVCLHQARAAEDDELQQRQPKLRSISGPEGGGAGFSPPYPLPAGTTSSSSPDDPGFTSTRAKSVGTDARPLFPPFLSEVASPQLLADPQHQQHQQQDEAQWQERRHSWQPRSERQRRMADQPVAANALTSAQVPPSGSRQTPQAEGAAASGQGKHKRKYRSRLNIPQRPFLAAATAARMEAARMVQQADESPEAGIHSAPGSATTSPILGVAISGGGGPRTVAGPGYPPLRSPDLTTGASMAQLPGTPVTPQADTMPGTTWQYPAPSSDSPSLRELSARPLGGQHGHTS